MKIVSVGPAPPWRGGIAQYHYAMVDALNSSGAEVEVLGFRTLYPGLLFPGSDQMEKGEGALPPIGERILRPLAPWTWRRAARWARRRDPDAVIFQWWHPFFAPAYMGLIAALGPGPRVGYVCHNVDPHERMPAGRWLTRRALARADFVVTGGRGMAEQIEAIAPEAKIAVVHHPAYELPGAPEPPSRAEARRRLELDPKEPVFLFFGLVRPYKGLDTLIEALALLPSEKAWHCVVAGEFYQDRAPYDARIAELGLRERMVVHDRFVSPRLAPDYFAACDVVVLPYHHATQSGVAALAFAMHRPVLTTRVGAIPETVREDLNGWIVPPDDPGALAARMRSVVEDPASARLPVCDGETGIPTWRDLADVLMDLATGVQPAGSQPAEAHPAGTDPVGTDPVGE